MISQRAIDLIVACEVTSRTVYEARYQHPEWPGGASGITIGIGYDLGYASREKIQVDWSGRISNVMLSTMENCAGVHGEEAHSLLPLVRQNISIPWEAANEVFMNRDIPQWTAIVCTAIPGADKLSPDCLGALVSLAYNRGASFSAPGERYTEMRAIREHIIAGELEKVPNDLRTMKQLWPTMKGLRDRRDAEADLFASGLAAGGSSPVQLLEPQLPDDAQKRIMRLQQSLLAAGFDPFGLDGRLGPNTIKAFQRSQGLAADGIVGPITKPLLEAAINN